MKEIKIKNTQCSTLSSSHLNINNIDIQDQRNDFFLNRVRQRINKNLVKKYSVRSSYTILNEINQTITGTFIHNREKQCILRTKIKDISKNKQEQRMQNFYPIQKSLSQIQDLVEYYKFYSQKSVIFLQDFFLLMYQYQERRKFVQYNQLKVLLNLSDSKDSQKSQQINSTQNGKKPNILPNTRVCNFKGKKSIEKSNQKIVPCFGINILNNFDYSQVISNSLTQQSVLINKLRSNLSKYVGRTATKNMSIQQLDKCFYFQKRDQNFNPLKSNFNNIFFTDKKNKNLTNKNRFSNDQSNCIQKTRREVEMRKRTNKRNYTCQSVQKCSFPKNSIEIFPNKLRRKKNLQMDFIDIYTSNSKFIEKKTEIIKERKNKIKTNEDENLTKIIKNDKSSKGSELLIGNISDLKSRIKLLKEKLVKETFKCQSSLKLSKNRQNEPCHNKKNNSSFFNTANQRFIKKNHEHLRQKLKIGTQKYNS